MRYAAYTISGTTLRKRSRRIMNWLAVFLCYAAATILVKPERRLDIHVPDKSHPLYDTKHNTAGTTAATDAVLMRYVWHWMVLGFNCSGGAN